MDAQQLTALYDNDPGSSVGYRENPVSGFDPIVTDIFLEPVHDLMGQEGNLRFIAALGISDDSLPVFDILGCEFQNLAYSHTTTGHEFEHEPVSLIPCSENDFINDVFFQDFELDNFSCPE